MHLTVLFMVVVTYCHRYTVCGYWCVRHTFKWCACGRIRSCVRECVCLCCGYVYLSLVRLCALVCIVTNILLVFFCLSRNVFRKNKALREFKQDDTVRVILLSSERAAAGTNLMEASHVVLMGKCFVLFFPLMHKSVVGCFCVFVVCFFPMCLFHWIYLFLL